MKEKTSKNLKIEQLKNIDEIDGIVLKLPIKIEPTINNDGYVITDSDDTEHFFYYPSKKDENSFLNYDGFCSTLK